VIGAAIMASQKATGWSGLGILILLLLFIMLAVHGLLASLASWLALRAARRGGATMAWAIVAAVLDVPAALLYGVGLPLLAIDIALAVSARRRPPL
jgi:hypothetical protein